MGSQTLLCALEQGFCQLVIGRSLGCLADRRGLRECALPSVREGQRGENPGMIAELLACITELRDHRLAMPTVGEQDQRLMQTIPGARVAEFHAGIAALSGLLEIVRDQKGVRLSAEQNRRGLAQTGETSDLGERPRSRQTISSDQMQLRLLNLKPGMRREDADDPTLPQKSQTVTRIAPRRTRNLALERPQENADNPGIDQKGDDARPDPGPTRHWILKEKADPNERE